MTATHDHTLADYMETAEATDLAASILGRPLTTRAWRALAARSGARPDVTLAGRHLWLPETVDAIARSAPGQGRRSGRGDPPPVGDSALALMQAMRVTVLGEPAPAVFTIPTLATWLGVKESTVRNWATTGKGPRRHGGRRGTQVVFEAADVRVWLKGRLLHRPRCPVTLAILAKHPRLRAHLGPTSRTTAAPVATPTATAAAAAEWLTGYLATRGGSSDSVEIKRCAQAAGFDAKTLAAARALAGVRAENVKGAFPRRIMWII